MSLASGQLRVKAANLARRLVPTVVASLLLASVVSADEGWLIERFTISLDIQPDGSIAAREALDVDFRGLSRHGIFRDIFYLFTYDETYNRRYDITLTEVTAADGRRHQAQDVTEGTIRRFRIGDPDRTISGKETYRIAYRIGGALNGFPDRDELYWNASGTWPVQVDAATVVVTAPGGAIERVHCFQGPAGSRERCDARFTPDEATFTATRSLAAGEEMTIVAGLRKGAVAEPRPVLVPRPRDITRSFDRTPGLLAAMGAGFLATLGGIGLLWWRLGRDRRYVSLYYLSQDAREERLPLFGSDPIVLEFEPPDHMRPAQMGLLVDERADTLDVNKFHDDLANAKKALYADAVSRGWFPRNPNTMRTLSRVGGFVAAAAGVALTFFLGRRWGAGLVGLPVIAGGLVLAMVSRAMPRRTAAGREAMRRALGFARYIRTAETRQQAFAERAGIFTSYLPYAIAIKCVDRWARAFKDIDLQQATAIWYAGGSRFDPGGFSSSLGSFSSSVSSTLASTPGGSGGSGFSGGSSGGGGGGGGGGSW